jgi:hypothetical protein
MLEARDAAKPSDEAKPVRPGKLEKVVAGVRVAYEGLSQRAKTCAIGEDLNAQRREGEVIIH